MTQHHTRLVIHDGDRERLLPIVDAFIVDVDLEAAVITVTPPDGMPDSAIEKRR